MTEQEQIKTLLESFFFLFRESFTPASEELIAEFQSQASKRSIPDSVVEQLVDFYKFTNGVPNLDGFTFHRCDDKNLFAWWSEKEEFFLGYRDSDVLRWKNNRFCLGNASRISYSADYEFSTLSDLLAKCFEKWYLGLWDRFVDSNNEIDLWRAKTR